VTCASYYTSRNPEVFQSIKPPAGHLPIHVWTSLGLQLRTGNRSVNCEVERTWVRELPPCVPPRRLDVVCARGLGCRRVPRPSPAPVCRLCRAWPRLVRHLPRRLRDPVFTYITGGVMPPPFTLAPLFPDLVFERRELREKSYLCSLHFPRLI
jgi:hypothetical protein